MSDIRRPLTYSESGVDIDAGNRIVERIRPFARRPAVPAPTRKSADSAACST